MLFPFVTISVKPIDYLLGKEDTETYKYLKQYTTMNHCTSADEISWYNPIKLLYFIGILSDKDTVEMKGYGTYKGGTGKDIFIIHKNFTGKEEGYRLIIKDFSVTEDKIDLSKFGEFESCPNIVFSNITLNKRSSSVLTYEGDEIVTLYGVTSDMLSCEIFV